MSMVGFKEAYEYSMIVRLSAAPVLDIGLQTLPGLALMKIISWNEKYPERRKDAADLLLIMHKYMVSLKACPDLGSHTEVLSQSQSRIRRDGPLTVDNGADSPRWNPDITGKPIDADARRFHELLQKDFAGMDRFQAPGTDGHHAPQC